MYKECKTAHNPWHRANSKWQLPIQKYLFMDCLWKYVDNKKALNTYYAWITE